MNAFTFPFAKVVVSLIGIIPVPIHLPLCRFCCLFLCAKTFFNILTIASSMPTFSEVQKKRGFRPRFPHRFIFDLRKPETPESIVIYNSFLYRFWPLLRLQIIEEMACGQLVLFQLAHDRRLAGAQLFRQLVSAAELLHRQG
jgi:hypothetical protein